MVGVVVAVVVTVVVVLVVEVVLVVLVDGAVPPPWSPPISSTTPKTISPIRMRTSRIQPTNIAGLRYQEVGSDSWSKGSGAGGWPNWPN